VRGIRADGALSDGALSSGAISDGALSELDLRVLAFEHERIGHDRNKEAAIRVEFDMSPARYYQVLGRVIDSPAALAHDPQLVTRLLRIRDTRTSARADRTFGTRRHDPEGPGAQ
jgi:hypothetical protein